MTDAEPWFSEDKKKNWCQKERSKVADLQESAKKLEDGFQQEWEGRARQSKAQQINHWERRKGERSAFR
jgi:hypothetical protein